MANEIVTTNIQQLLEEWKQAEQNGVQFPVPLHDHWNIAGHRKVQDAFLLLESRQEEGFDYLRSTVKTGKRGQPRQARFLSVAALERFCLAAHTAQGDAVRELYRQAKAKWDLVQQVAPQFAQEIEILQLKAEIAKQEAIKMVAEEKVLSIRHYATKLPEAVQQKILGYTEIKTVEYRDRVIHDKDIIRDGSTINKTEMCRRMGLMTKGGSPNYKALNAILCQMNLPKDSWRMTASLRENEELTIEAWEIVQDKWLDGDRNLFVGE